ncbi:beta-glucanase [Streptomyces sp. NPDC004327]|uniref:beta-glucanase n=1 Tax=Streptomyces sp. NPDC004327 TaxID=3364699 RepID=UPI0036871EC1
MTTWPPADEPVFTADFDSREQWTAGRSWAYPGGGPVNPGDNKLDYLSEDPAYSAGGVFRATLRPDGRWDTGLLTTQDAPQGFELRTGDTLEARVRLPEVTGAWPAIWTWRDGGSEVDVFEYHPDNPDLLELSNHVRGASHYHRSPSVSPGAWIRLRTEFGARSVVWWLDDAEIFADGRGVGRNWRADLIVNLSVCAGRYHPAPPPQAVEMSYEVSDLRVYRSAGGGWPGWP